MKAYLINPTPKSVVEDNTSTGNVSLYPYPDWFIDVSSRTGSTASLIPTTVDDATSTLPITSEPIAPDNNTHSPEPEVTHEASATIATILVPEAIHEPSRYTTTEDTETTDEPLVIVATSETPISDTDFDTTSEIVLTSLGTFKITQYNPSSDYGKWGYQTATGERSRHLATCATDWSVIPKGSIIIVGDLELKVVDNGVRGRVIDVFYDGSESEANKWVSGFGASHEVFQK